MIRRLRLYSLPFAITTASASGALAAEFQIAVNYGGSTNMNLLVPDTVDASPGVVVALHSCGNQYESDSQNYVKTSAEEYGFLVIQPTNGNPDCWTSDAGQDGEKPNIMAMVDYVIENHNADANRIYAMGASSGACMTLALMATHPDVFKAGSVLAGVPYGAWRQGGSCSVCNQAATAMSEDAWGNIVRQNAPANYAGPWPRIQLWHGDADSTLVFGWMAESEKQWKNVHGVTGAGAAGANPPAGWARTEYTQDDVVVLQVNSGAGKDHYLPDDIPQAEFVKFFGLDTAAAPGDTGGDSSDSDETGRTSVESSDTGLPGEETASTTSDTAPSSSVETSSSPSTNSSATPPPATDPPATSNPPPPTPIAPTPPASTSTPAPVTSAPPATSDTTVPPVEAADNGGDAGCQCDLGASSRPVGSLAIVLLGSVVAVGRRRSRRK